MTDNLTKALFVYCNKEINNFKHDKLFIKLNTLVNKLHYNMHCEVGKDKKKSSNIYLSVIIYNCENKMIEIYDDGFLLTSTLLISIDRKQRLRFYSWNDDEFIADLEWIIKNLEIILNNTTK